MNIMRFAIHGFSYATVLVGGYSSTYLGESSGKAVATTAAVYASSDGILFGVLIFGWVATQAMPR